MDKILLVTAFTPSENAAAEKNTKLMLRDLCKSFDVDLVYFKYEYNKVYVNEAENIRVKKIIHNSKFFKYKNVAMRPMIHPYFSVRYRRSIQKFLNSLISESQYKAIILDHSQVFLYGKYLKIRVHKILIAHDVMAQRTARSKNSVMAWFCRWSERKVLNQKNAVVSTFNQKDVELIKSYYDKNAILCLNYIDERIIHYKRTSIDDSYVFFGNWKRPDNYEGALWFFKNVAPLIKEKTNIKVIGKGFPIEKMKLTNPLVHVDFLGFVDDPYPIIANCRAELSPLFSGAGIKVKVIESLASGTPVVGTEITFEGFDSKYRDFMFEANTPETFYYGMLQCSKSLNQREDFKQMFIKDYQSLTIPKYIESLKYR